MNRVDPTSRAYHPGRPIRLVPHDAGWGAEFVRESARLGEAFGEFLVRLHHIGSTAIAGIAAKPVIDMLAEVTEIGLIDGRNGLFEGLGYEAMGEFGIAGRRYFRKDSAEGERTHQIHVFTAGSPNVVRHLAFRDYLRAHPEEARRYEQLKIELAGRFGNDIEGYADAKTQYIREIERRAMG